jgi:HD superfamily phosphohydrolase
MPEHESLTQLLKDAAPSLHGQVDRLATQWLSPLVSDANARGPPQDKHINDPIWGTITLHPWEVALLDTPLVQRMRGVKQLGLAHLVFPTATHDRFSHACGVVEAVERMMDHVGRNTKARVRSGRAEDASPTIADAERYLIRLAALIHDVGHGPFSHAIEPVVARLFQAELKQLESVLRRAIPRTEKVQVS